MITDEEMFNSRTKEAAEDEIFNSQTRCHPHKITLCYSLDLAPTIVQKFPSQAIRKQNGDRVWFARDPNADVCLFDTDFPRNCMELKCSTSENGQMLVTVKNLNNKKLVELNIPGRDKISLGMNQESRIDTHTLLSISLMPLIAIFQNGDVDSSNYEVVMSGLDSQDFNKLMLSTSGSTQLGNATSGRPPISVLPPQAIGSTSSFGYPALSPFQDLSNSWPTSSFSSQTRPKQFYAPESPRNPSTSYLGYASPPNDININSSAELCSCGFGVRQGNIITNPESYQCSSQAFIDLHQRDYDRQTSCQVCNPSVVPCTHQGIHYSQSSQQGNQQRQRCSSDSQRMLRTPIYNWHNHTTPGGLPTAPAIRDNYVNTHPYTEATPHDFNVNIIDMYKQ